MKSSPVFTRVGLQKQNILKHIGWLKGHQPHCRANYKGTSGEMEEFEFGGFSVPINPYGYLRAGTANRQKSLHTKGKCTCK